MLTLRNRVFSYTSYLRWVRTLVNHRFHVGAIDTTHRDRLIRLNYTRMIRLNRNIDLSDNVFEALLRVHQPQIWMVIAEPWCGDCAQNLPGIFKIAQHPLNLIDLRIILRDENPEWIRRYHTNGSQSVPRLIAFDMEGNELFTWGPRPAPAQDIVISWLQNPLPVSRELMEQQIHNWYYKDQSVTLQNELINLITSAAVETELPINRFYLN
jgi:hypothetical protein